MRQIPDWQSSAREVVKHMTQRLKDAPADRCPDMAWMTVDMIATLRHETPEQALRWLTSNPKASNDEDHPHLWLVRI